MKLTHVRDVIAVAECGSLRAAARRLRVAQPALTRSIQEIERELGVSLFERHARGVRTTPMGATFLRRAHIADGELRRAAEEIAQLKGGTTGQVAIAMSTASTIALMPGASAAFRRRYPQALLKVTESLFPDIEGRLADGDIDFYVGPFDPGHGSATTHHERLFDYRRLILARKGHPLEGARRIEDLRHAQWARPLTLSPQSSEVDFDATFERINGAPPDVVLSAHSALMTLMVVADSDLLTILPQQWLELPLALDRLVTLDIAGIMPDLSMCIVRRKDMPLTPMAEHLCDVVRRAALHYAARADRP